MPHTYSKKFLRLMPAQERKQYILPSLPKLGKKNKMTFKQYKRSLLFSYCLVVEDIMSRGVLLSLHVHLLLMKKPFFFLPTCKREGTKEIFFFLTMATVLIILYTLVKWKHVSNGLSLHVCPGLNTWWRPDRSLT